MPTEVWVQLGLNVPVLVLAIVGVYMLGQRFDRLEAATRETTARVIDLLGDALERSDPGRRHPDEDTHDGNTEPHTTIGALPAPPPRRRK